MVFEEPALNVEPDDASPNNAKPLAQAEGTHTRLLTQLDQACAQREVTGDLGFVAWMKAPQLLLG